MNKTKQSETTIPGQSDISTSRSSGKLVKEIENMNSENFRYWEATREMMNIVRRRNNCPEARRQLSGNEQDHEKKLFDVLSKLKNGYRAIKRKFEFFMNQKGHENDENGVKWMKRKWKPY